MSVVVAVVSYSQQLVIPIFLGLLSWAKVWGKVWMKSFTPKLAVLFLKNSFVIQVRSLFVQASAHLFVKSHKPWRRLLARMRLFLVHVFKSVFSWYLKMPLWLRTAIAIAVLLATAGSSFAVFALLIIPQPLLDWFRARIVVILNRLGVTRLFMTIWNLFVPEALRHRWHIYLKWTLGRRQVRAAQSVLEKVRRTPVDSNASAAEIQAQ
ncbi:MAG: hypothetical protein AAF098_11760 [Pseudomonadota bacterium]